MATPGHISVTSYQTALCIIPPEKSRPAVDRLRALYDKAFGKWPPHVNLIYPFVSPEALPQATDLIGAAIQQRLQTNEPPLRISLNSVGVFPHKHDNTIFLHDSDEEQTARLNSLRRDILQSLGQRDNEYRMHMTVAQTEDITSSMHKFLDRKVGLLPGIEWEVKELHILVRQQVHSAGSTTSQMKLWGTISLSTGLLTRSKDGTETLYHGSLFKSQVSVPPTETTTEELEQDESGALETRRSYYFDDEMLLWSPYEGHPSEPEAMPRSVTVSSYNVLGEFDWPPSRARYPLIVKNTLSSQAAADILVLQEVTDDFLCYLLRDERVRDLYPFTSHGPPDQPDIEPLPSLVNIVMLSKWPFEWEWLSLSRKHKGALIATFDNIGKNTKAQESSIVPTVVAAVHLNHGLTDGAVTAKKVDIQSILGHLSRRYEDHPCILAGDFNISTSSTSINAAVKKGSISAQTVSYLQGFDKMFEEAEFADAWQFAMSELDETCDTELDAVDELAEGESGSTYDPLVNEVAASIVGSGSNMRPQRYDRILIRGEGLLAITKFNKFGFLKGRVGDDSEPSYASDHWGVRCVLRTLPQEPEKASEEIAKLVVPVHHHAAPEALSNEDSVWRCLDELGVISTNEEIVHRRDAFNLLQNILRDNTSPSTLSINSSPPLIIVPVGSYGLDVWTSASDMDILCIGPFSATTFFTLAVQRLRRASLEDDAVRILRRVKAQSGTMLELSIHNIKTDLQYCPATSIAESWPHVLRTHPPTDPIWSLPLQSLSKLKAARDMDYLKRTTPDIKAFRLAHRFLTTWAKSRGIYAARFGCLGGMQISLLLVRVQKLLAAKNAHVKVSVPDLLATFFQHYAEFDFRRDLVFDPFFHSQKLNYTRSPREPLAVLGYFPPQLNTAAAASGPSVRTVAEEFRRAAAMLDSGSLESWTEFVAGRGLNPADPSRQLSNTGAQEFLGAYKSYAKIDVQYWGLSLAKGAQFVGWLESRFVNVLVDIERRVGEVLHARMWPARFVAGDEAGAEEEADGEGPRDYRGCYLVGLGKLDDARVDKDKIRDALGALRSVLSRFEEQIRGDERYFDGKSCWMSADVVSGYEIEELELVVDRREWGVHTPGEEIEEDEEEEEIDLAKEEAEVEHGAKTRRKAKTTAETVVVPKLEPGKKFRTAADVLNRLRWDPGMDSGDFIVGYEDRFVGAREKALDTWKSEQTDEEFIPQHRILYFKRKSDGVVVWERRTRKDEVFGSGV